MKSSRKLFMTIAWAALVLLLLSISFFAIPWRQPQVYGDGWEYVVTTQAILRHGTPDFNDGDVVSLHERFECQNPHIVFPEQLFSAVSVLGRSGRRYAIHFWFYPYVVAAVQFFVRMFGGNELWAFAVTNLILLVVMALVVLRWFPGGRAQKWALTFLLVCSPLVPYVKWTHAEVFVAATVSMALVSYLRKNWALALFLSSLATMQNPAVGMLPIICLLMQIRNVCRQFVTLRMVPWRSCAGIVLSLLPGLCYLAFNHGEFETENLIRSLGASSFSCISLSRIMGFWFDLDHGLVVGSVALVMLFFLTTVKSVWSGQWQELDLVVMLFAAIVMATTTVNWNSGCEGLMRYCVCYYPFVAFAVVRHASCDWPFWLLVVGSVCCQLFMNGFGCGRGYLSSSALTKFLFENAPSVYNPDYEVFAEHVRGQDSHTVYNVYRLPGSTNDVEAVAYEEWLPIIRSDSTLSVRKVLTNFARFACLSNEYEILDMDAYLGAGRRLSRHSDVQYVNFRRGAVVHKAVALPATMDFARLSENVLQRGFGGAESSGRWSLGKCSELTFRTTKSKGGIKMILKGCPIAFPDRPPLGMSVKVNGRTIQDIDLPNKWEIQVIRSTIPDWAISGNGLVRLEFVFSTTIKPILVNINKDPRELAFFFQTIEFHGS